ncbi:MAG: Tm-1-like ATP-binding domain-containing protein, partial [Planctomycetota bacterium]|nr:Tm-1-like ATP-binding domain-containing protein [Planctomycetota bacterium]
VVDVGVMGAPSIQADVTRETVAGRGGGSIASLQASHDRGTALDTMIRGAEHVIAELYQQGKIAGVISMGGSGGTAIGTAAMRRLPLGVPKVMVSTLASGDTQPYVGTKDICMIHSVVDFSGVNAISRPILRSAAGAVCGMVQAGAASAGAAPHDGAGRADEGDVRLVAASMFGVTTKCVNTCRDFLTASGLQLIPFHATGIGGRTMESLIEEGFFTAVLDITTTEWADEVVGGTLSAGPTRLEAAAKAGLPQVVVPGAIDMVNFVGPAGLPERFRGRTIYRHNENVILMRTTTAECAEIGRRIADKLNDAAGPTTVVFPMKGLSALDVQGGIFYDPEANQSLLEALKAHCRPAIRVLPVDAHINDEAFARRCCDELLANLSLSRANKG